MALESRRIRRHEGARPGDPVGGEVEQPGEAGPGHLQGHRRRGYRQASVGDLPDAVEAAQDRQERGEMVANRPPYIVILCHARLAPFDGLSLQPSEGEVGCAGELRRQPLRLANPDLSQGHPDRCIRQTRVEGFGDPDLEDEARLGAREVVRHVYNPVYMRAGGIEKPGIFGGSENGGGSGIRTRDTVSRIHTFQACAFNHSATPPA